MKPQDFGVFLEAFLCHFSIKSYNLLFKKTIRNIKNKMILNHVKLHFWKKISRKNHSQVKKLKIWKNVIPRVTKIWNKNKFKKNLKHDSVFITISEPGLITKAANFNISPFPNPNIFIPIFAGSLKSLGIKPKTGKWLHFSDKFNQIFTL